MTARPALGAAAPYAAGGVRERIEAALRGAGKDFDALTPADLAGGLASFEHFHSLGLPGTTALIEAAHVTAADHVLDAGSSIGGTARLLAADYGCRVTAIDLTKMKSGSADPSFAPFWIPGQSIHAQYVSPQWTKAVLPPPH